MSDVSEYEIDLAMNLKDMQRLVQKKYNNYKSKYNSFIEKDKVYDKEEFNEIHRIFSDHINFLQELDAYETYTNLSPNLIYKLTYGIVDVVNELQTTPYMNTLINTMMKGASISDFDEQELATLNLCGINIDYENGDMIVKRVSNKVNMLAKFMQKDKFRKYITHVKNASESYIGGASKLRQREIRKLEDKVRELSVKYEHSRANSVKFTIDKSKLIGVDTNIFSCKERIIDGVSKVNIKSSKVVSDIIMTTCDDEKVRSHAFNVVNNENIKKLDILSDILRLRRDLVKLKNRNNYAEYTCENEASLLTIKKFIKIYSKKYKEYIKPYFSEFNKMLYPGVHDDGEPKEIFEYNLAYAMNKYTEREFGISNKYLLKFNYAKIVSNIFDFYQRNYNIRYEKFNITTNSGVELTKYKFWHRDSGKLLGHIYLDMSNHKKKLSGSLELSANKNSYNSFAISVISTSIPRLRDGDNTMSLTKLSYIDVLFHEIGHAMQNLFSNFKFSHISSVSPEFVEIPSQIMELFMNKPEVIQEIMEVNEEESIRIMKYHRLNLMISDVLYLARAMFDIKIHQHIGAYNNDYLVYTWRKCFSKYANVKFDEKNNDDSINSLGISHFNHPGTTTYAGKYYNYLLGQVYCYHLFDNFDADCNDKYVWKDFSLLLKYTCLINPVHVFRWFINAKGVDDDKKNSIVYVSEPKIDPLKIFIHKFELNDDELIKLKAKINNGMILIFNNDKKIF